MKKFILILSLSFMSVCTLAQGPSYPEGTVLGLKVDEVPNLPECTEQDIKAGQSNTRCISKFIVGDKDWETTIVLIPEQENNLPFPAYISYSMSPNISLGIIPQDNVDFDTVMNYLNVNYGNAIDHKTFENLDIYEFHSERIKVELKHYSDNRMAIIFSNL